MDDDLLHLHGDSPVIRALILIVLLAACTLAMAADEELAPTGENGNSSWWSQGSSSNPCSTSSCELDVDEDPDGTPDGNIVATQTDSSFLVFDFNTPGDTPATGTDAQAFHVLMSECDDTSPMTESVGSGVPTYDIYLYCNGSSVSAIATGVAINSQDQSTVHTWTMNLGSCAADGSDVQVGISQTANGGGPNKRWGCIEALEWEVTYTVAEAGRTRRSF